MQGLFDQVPEPEFISPRNAYRRNQKDNRQDDREKDPAATRAFLPPAAWSQIPPSGNYRASMLNLAEDVFPALVILTAIFQEPDMERFITALYMLPLTAASVL